MPNRAHPRRTPAFGPVVVASSLALLAGRGVSAQETASAPTKDEGAARKLTFDWPLEATVEVTSDNRRETRAGGPEGEPTESRSFRLRFDLVIRPEKARAGGGVIVGRRNVRTVRWNGREVPASARSILAPVELQSELLPDLHVGSDGRVRSLETPEELQERVTATLEARVKRGDLDRKAADELAASLGARVHEALGVQAEKAWDEWIGRWNDLDFRERADAVFDGEVELWTGDVVDGRFTAAHRGPVEGLEDHVGVELEFVASGPRLDLAALKWKQRLLDTQDERFRIVRLEFRERSEAALRPGTMQPARVTTSRETTMHEDDETETIVETSTWTFAWR